MSAAWDRGGAAVTVTDRISYSAIVSPEQAVAYCRRILVPKGYEETEDVGPPGVWLHFKRPGDAGAWVSCPLRAEAIDYARRMVELCDEIVGEGIASRPSDVLRAMAETTV